MDGTQAMTQESRTERATVSLTPTEKRAVRAVAALWDTDESNLLRDWTLEQVIEEYEARKPQPAA